MERKISKPINILSVAIVAGGILFSGYTVNNHYQEQLDRKQDSIVELKKDLSNANIKNEDLNSRLNDSKKTEKDLNDKIKKANKEVDSKEEQIKMLEQRNDELKKQVKTYKDKSEAPSVSTSKSTTVSRGKESGRKVSMVATAYTAYCDTGCTGVTATGINVSNSITHNGQRIIATDTSIIPLYSLVKVEAKGETFYAQVLDTGGAIKGNKIDVLVGSHDTAIQFGKQNVTLTVLREGKGT